MSKTTAVKTSCLQSKVAAGFVHGKNRFLGRMDLAFDFRLVRTVSHLSVEIFFAVLPVIVLSMIWLISDGSKDEPFWHGPELSMTSCVLFGLTLARLQQGVIVGAKNASGDIHGIASRFSLIFIIPLIGVIASTILIAASSLKMPSHILVISQITLLILAFVSCMILGGYGVDRFETD